MNKDITYLEHFHLKYNPFPVAPDTTNFFISRTIDRIITEITHGIETRKGFMILVGEVGLGKTTIGRKIMSMLEQAGIETSMILHTGFQGAELLKEINRDFKIRARSGGLGDQLRKLNDFLLKKSAEGKNCAIIIDDAQNLSAESLELVRMISNLESDREKLVQVLLIGQPELLKKLASPELRQLQSRVIIHQEVRPLSRHELKDYIFFKLNAAGNDGTTTVSSSGLRAIYKTTKGNFRKVNALMDRCLYAGFVLDTTKISRRIVKKAFLDLRGKPIEFYHRPLSWALSGALGLCLIGGFYLSRDYLDSFRKSIPVSMVSAHFNKQVPGQVLSFLRDYGLSSYAAAFFDGLTHGSLNAVSRKILQDTGLCLIELAAVPETVRHKFGVLVYPAQDGTTKRFYVFWRPSFWVEHFYYGYEGPEIRKIQEILADLSLYHDNVDGIVGKNLMKAVVEFQKMMRLRVTGYPDQDTLFLMCNIQETKSYGVNSTPTKTTG
ncbi:MAG TPA: AAA family ATPase [Desulfobacterales bacterium]|nr:AAA family ATPase [Desulfobacterales bacterium]